MEFSYLLNAPCMNNMEYNPKYYRELIDYIQWIVDIGSDSVIVTIPFLIQVIKKQFPDLKIRVSTISHVNSVNRAKFYEYLGASEITPDVMINRDFDTLEHIQKAINGKLVLLLTDGCLFQCPFRYYHYNILGHASQTNQEFGRNYVDSCILNCSIIKFSNPTEVLKCRWIRPEDLKYYEEIGIHDFKIAGRRMSTDWIVRSVKAFSERKYEGNLIDIIQGFSMSFGGLESKDPNLRVSDTIGKESRAKLYIDNTKLDGFIDFFKNQNCNAMCDECNYCTEWAKKAVIVNEEQSKKYVNSLQSYLNDLTSGREFGIGKTEGSEDAEKIGLEWNAETRELFDKLIKLTPDQFQSMAKIAIGNLAEEKAKKRGETTVQNDDMVAAFLQGTPGPFQDDMKEGLRKYNLIE
ncbi:MAG: hypothetical protein EU547_05790 [Promethearchaeota archaeon]|nr:MAG: hypothetical protein EU547_05790 [Candidatus Lokiarchaeota archaeon]